MKEFVKRFFISENGEIDWVKLCETYPEFEKLKNVPQSPKWHAEGNAFIHTQNVYNEMLKILLRENVTDDTTFYLSLLIALFHDVGKGNCIV